MIDGRVGPYNNAPLSTSPKRQNVALLLAPKTTILVVFAVASIMRLNAAPTITSLSPTSGAAGTPVTITGTNFGSTQGASTITLNGTSAISTFWGTTAIQFSVPSGASTGNVVVTVGGQASNGVSFTVNSSAPVITSLSPVTGTTGTSVTIIGNNFGSTQGTNTVKFNGVTASVTSWSNTSIVASDPAGSGDGNVIVTVGGIASNGIWFPAPVITSVTPNSGQVGASINVTGTDFRNIAGTVFFNGLPATVTSSWQNNLTVTVPSGATTGNIVLETFNGILSNGVNFTVGSTPPTPTIGNLSPTSGAAGTPVTITGTNFGSSQGSSTVTLNGTSATPTFWGTTAIQFSVPNGASTGNVLVTVGGQTSNGVNFTVNNSAPVITSLSPVTGTTGTSVTVSGNNFGSTQGSSTVKYNGVTASVTSWSNTSIVSTRPSGAGDGNVVVTVGGVASNGIWFPAPVITSVSPNSGPVGASINVTGTDFRNIAGTVFFNGLPATVTSSWQNNLTVTVPSGATTGNTVIETFNGILSNGVNFTVVSATPPSITSLAPTSGVVGTSVTITGTNFGATQGTSTVKFNGHTATPTSWSATSIVTPVPGGATSGNVVVTVGGQASNGSSFTVIPSISGLSPNSGAPGTSVTISGTGFGATQGTSTVTFNGSAATPTSWSATSIVVPVPSNATTGNVVVTVGGQASNSSVFTVVSPAPVISNLSPSSGPVGTSVTITGSNFGATQGASTVTFNGTAATPASWSATSIAVPVPSGATTGNVVVSVSGQASNGSSFTVIPPPSITTLSPTSGPVGTAVTITGTNFGSTQGASTVTFSGTAATPTSWSASSIVVPVPSGASTGNVVVAVSGISSNSASFTVGSQNNPPAIKHSYDASGRLTAVTDSLGNSAVYTYDAVGNILSISHIGPGQVSIIGFSPTLGPVGATVTVDGTGFSATASQNTVSFNGTPATVLSATTTQLLVNVPVGATTGTISVTAPNGSATSSSQFVIGTVLSITSVSPTIGSVGTAVTISGTNFDPTPTNNSLRFNATQQAAITVTGATSISTSVPSNASSGVITLVNLSGVASSGQDFFIPPLPFTATDVGFTGRTTIGNTTAVTISTTGQIGLLLFDAVGGQQVEIQTSNSTIANCIVSLLDPFGNVLASGSCISSGALVSPTLPSSGTYTVLVDTGGGSGGTVSIGLNVASSTAGSIVIDGPPVSVVTSVAGQQASLLFKGTASQHVTMSITNSNYADCNISVHDPTGAQIANVWCSRSTGFVDIGILPSTGNYTIWVSPVSSPGGSLTLQLNGVTDVTGNIVVDGPAVSIAATLPAQYARLAFTVTSSTGLHITASITNGMFAPGSCNLTVFNPNGFNINSDGYNDNWNDCSGVTNSSDFEIFAPGQYTLVVAPVAPATGSLTVQLTRVADINYSITANGPPLTVNIPTPGQNARVTFTGIAGQHVTLQTSADLFASCEVSFHKPDGLMLVIPTGAVDYKQGCSAPTFIDISRLPMTGTYTILTHPAGVETGSVNLQLRNVSDVTGTITIDGPPVNISTTVPGQNAVLTFNATAGQRVVLNVSNNTFSSCALALFSPPGGGPIILPPPKNWQDCTNANNLLETLPLSGMYTISLTPQAPVTGSLTLQLTSPPADATAAVTIDGPAVSVSTLPGQRAKVTFSGVAGQKVIVNVSGQTSWGCNLALISGGSVLTQGQCAGNGTHAFIDATTLPSSVTYTVLIDPSQLMQANSFTVQVQTAPSDVVGTIVIDGSPVTATTTTPFQDVRLSFTATAGQHVTVYVSNISNPSAQLYLLRPDGSVEASTSFYSNSVGFIDSQTLSASGTYQLWIRHSQTNIGSETLQLKSAPSDVTGTITIDGPTVTSTTGIPGQDVRLSFGATAGQRVVVYASNITTTANLSLLTPGGAVQTSMWLSAGSGSTAFIDTQTLSATGTYQLWLQHNGPTVGSVTLQISSVPADVSGSITVDGPSVSVSTVSGQNARLTFSGTAGQKILANLTGGGYPSSTPYSYSSCRLTLNSPTGAPLATTNCGGISNFLDVTSLPTTGTYAIVVDPQGPVTGGLTVQLKSAPPDMTGTISIDGPAVTISTSQPGQDARLTFSASAGQRINVSATNITNLFGNLNVLLPSGAMLTGTAFSAWPTNSTLLGPQSMPLTGTYQLWVQHNSTYTGSETLQITSVPADIAGSIAIDGAPVTVTTTAPGQTATLTFSGSAGQKISVAFAGNSYSGCSIYVYNPAGTSMGGSSCYNSPGVIDLTSTPLPATGTYKVLVTPQGTATGSLTLQIKSVPADITGSLTIDGPAVTVATTSAGQDARLTFSATSGQRLVLTATNVTNPSATAVILAPDGSTLTSMQICSRCGALSTTTQVAPATGTYTVWIQHYYANVGQETLQLKSVPADVTGTIVIDGPPVTVTTSASGQGGQLTFSGTAGQKVTLSLTLGTFNGCSLRISGPSGTVVTNGNCAGATNFIDTTTLMASGTYSIAIVPQGTPPGSVTVQLQSAPDITGTISIGGPAVTVTTTKPGQDARLTFSGTAGQQIDISATHLTNPVAYLVLLAPDGSQQGSVSVASSQGSAVLNGQALPITGTYQLWVEHNGAYTGSETIQISGAPPDVTASLTVDGAPVTVTTTLAGQRAKLTFAGTAGKTIILNSSSSTISYYSCYMTLYSPSGSSAVNSNCGGTGNTNVASLALTGTYTIVITPQGNTVGSVTVQAQSAPPDLTGMITVDGPPVSVTTTAGQDARLTFSATAGERIITSINDSSNTYATVALVAPTGGVQASTGIWAGYSSFMPGQTLVNAGTYTMWVQHGGASGGTETIQITSVPADISGTITIDGSPLTVTSAAGQVADITFSGVAGQEVLLSITNGTFNNCGLTITIPGGPTLVSTYCSGASNLIGPVRLPITGIYQISLTQYFTSSGHATLQLQTAPPDVSGVLAANGSAVTVNTVVGQDAKLTFTGTAGQMVSFAITNVTNPSALVNLIAPTGMTIFSNLISSNSGNAFIGTQTLPATGTYTLWISHNGFNAGGETIQLYGVVNATGTVSSGSPVSVNISTPGEQAVYMFTGTAGQRASVGIDSWNVPGCWTGTVSILNPDGSTLTSGSLCNGTAFLDAVTLPTSGSYQVNLTPSGSSTGTANINLYLFADVTGFISSGTPVNTNIVYAGQNAIYTFSGNAGDRATVNVGSWTASGCWTGTLNITSPDGTTLSSTSLCNGTASISGIMLPQSGNYSVLFDPAGSSTGAATVTVYTFSDLTQSVVVGTPTTVNIGQTGQNANLTFSGTAGQEISVQLSNNTISGGNISVLNPVLSQFTAGQNYPIKMEYFECCGGGASAGLQWSSPSTPLQLIPPSELYPLGSSSSGGLFGEYFDETYLSGGPNFTEVDPFIDFNWNGTSPGGSLPGTNYSIRWSGQAQAQYSEQYTFCTTTDDGVRLWVNNILVIDDWQTQGATQLCSGQPTNLVAPVGFSGSTGYIDTFTLPTTGTYTLLIAPQNGSTGSMTVLLNNVPPDTGPAITPGGAPVQITAGTPGQNVAVSFSGTAGQKVSLQLTGNTIPGSNVSILNPVVGPLTAGQTYSLKMEYFQGCCDSEAHLKWASPSTLEQVIPQAQLYPPASSTATGLQGDYFNGTSLAGTPAFTEVDPTVDFPWHGVSPGSSLSGSNFSVRWTGQVQAQYSELYTFCTSTDDGARLWINGLLVVDDWQTQGTTEYCSGKATNLVAPVWFNGGTTYVDTVTLPVTGTYTIYLDPQGANTGNVTLTLNNVPPNASASASINGSAVNLTVGTPGQNAQVTFSGTSGQLTTVHITSNTVAGMNVTLLNPDGSTATSTNSGSSSFNLSQVTLGAAGTYTVVLDPTGTNTGSFAFTITSP